MDTRTNTAINTAYRMLYAFGVTDKDIALYMMEFLAKFCKKIKLEDAELKFREFLKNS